MQISSRNLRRLERAENPRSGPFFLVPREDVVAHT